MCLCNCTKVNNDSDILCYKYVVIKHSGKRITICSPFHPSFHWDFSGKHYYSYPAKENYPNERNRYGIGPGFFHVMSSFNRTVGSAHQFEVDDEDDIVAVFECTIPNSSNADTFYGDINDSKDDGFATTHLIVNKIIYLDKPIFYWNEHSTIFENLSDYRRYRKRMRAFNDIKKRFGLNETNCNFVIKEKD